MPHQTLRSTSLADPRNARHVRREDALKALLRVSPPDVWYDVLRRADPDTHGALILWMVNQKDCDFAVAVHAFLQSAPDYAVRRGLPLPAHPGPDQIWAAVIHNWHRGLYRSHEIACDAGDLQGFARLLRAALDQRRPDTLSFPVPAPLLDLDGGRPVSVPASASPDQSFRVWHLYRALGLRVDPAPPGLRRVLAHALRGMEEHLGTLRARVTALRFWRHRHLFESHEAFVDWVSFYFVNRARHDEILRLRLASAEPNPALRFGAAMGLSAAFGLLIASAASLGLLRF